MNLVTGVGQEAEARRLDRVKLAKLRLITVLKAEQPVGARFLEQAIPGNREDIHEAIWVLLNNGAIELDNRFRLKIVSQKS